jgi:AraC-like DNA-binding protein
LVTALATPRTSLAPMIRESSDHQRQNVFRIDPLPRNVGSDSDDGDATLVLIPAVAGKGRSASALYIPDPAATAREPGAIEGLRLDSRRLADAAARLSEFAWSPRRFEQLLLQPISIQAGSKESDRYLQRLLVLASLVHEWGGQRAVDVRQLGMGEVLDRLVVLSFWGEWILGVTNRRASGAAEKASIIGELLGWIRANCHRSISLAELEKRSGYSQRSLRNAFQERFGCAPNEWIRRTRMESARQRLLDARPTDTVSSIALEHGYSHVSQFSRDFRGVFGLQPSQVMRHGRRPID